MAFRFCKIANLTREIMYYLTDFGSLLPKFFHNVMYFWLSRRITTFVVKKGLFPKLAWPCSIARADCISSQLTWSSSLQCEEVCRLALRRRYRLLPHIYTLFYRAHTRGIPVATPTFFAGMFL